MCDVVLPLPVCSCITFPSLAGIQEYVEAVSFQHFIRHRTLISLEEINARLVFMKGEKAEAKVPLS